MAPFDLNAPYNRDEYLAFLRREFLPEDFEQEEKRRRFTKEYAYIEDAVVLGESPSLGLKVFEITHPSAHDPRVSLTRETFHFMRAFNDFNALAIYTTPASDNYRLSYVTIGAFLEERKVMYEYSNPRRYSYFLGPGARINTPYRYLIQKGRVKGTADFQERFSVEVVNKEFYLGIADLFNELVDERLKLPSIADHRKKQEFAVRMIGRAVFCWFLKKKSTRSGGPLLPEEILSLNAVKKNEYYYHTILEKLFFQVLNTPQDRRRDEFKTGPFANIPFLNGGLFEPHADDIYEPDEFTGLSHINDLKVPDGWMKDFFELLERYNFTIDENTSMDVELSVDPEMLGRIFENLLAVINPETGEIARKSTGSYYTPRPIVEYMVDESLKQYLKTQTGIHEKKVELLLSFSRGLDEVEEAERPTREEARTIIDALDQVKIIDPACGSGAFPMGTLQKLVLILEKIDPKSELWLDKSLEKVPYELQQIARQSLQKENVNYIHKMGLIRGAIYGVDIQQIAVEISRLRVFLSLIVDTTIDEKKPNLGIPPLPNLEFKFVCADTLIGLPREGKDTQKGLFEDQGNIRKLKELRDQYFGSYGDKKEKIKEEFKQTQDRMSRHTLSHGYDAENAEKTTYLASWDPFSDKSSDWFEPDWMFGIKDGFDIVIGNPPYIQIQNFSGKKQQKDWEKQEYETYIKTGDVYCLFYERGYKLLKDGGVLTFITSNKWMRAKYGKVMREFFITNGSLLQLIDFGDSPIFKNATTYTNILVWEKSTKKEKTKAWDLSKAYTSDTTLLDLLEKKGECEPIFSEDSFVIVKGEHSAIKKRIEEIGVPLKNWDIAINYGIKTGLNEAFIIDGKKKDELVAKDPKSAEILKPILRGRDIKRYKAEFANLWMIFIPWHFPLHRDNSITGASEKSELEFNQQYSAIYNHLLKHKPELSARNKAETGIRYEWYALQRCANTYLAEFEKEKIIYPNITKYTPFFLDKKGYFTNQKCFIITSKTCSLPYLTGILNSWVFDFAFRSYFPNLMDDTVELSKVFFEKLPIPKLSPEKQIPFEILVDCILFAKEKGMEEESILLESVIDGMVFDLYFPDEMKKAHCYITGVLTEILRPFKEDDTESFKSEYIRTLYEFCKNDKTISHSLIHRRTVKPVQVILGEKE